VPRLHISNWRQLAISITKEKFLAKERVNFDLVEGAGEDTKDKLYLVISTLRYRSYHASESWHIFFRFDHLLQGKQLRGASEMLSYYILDNSKYSYIQRKDTYTEADLQAIVYKLYNVLYLQFRVPGQQNSVLAVLGP
jgi:hypothetical protein